jgi:FkbM family methyltransferase
MLIPFKNLVYKYNISKSVILHIGAHECEELREYNEMGFDKVIWIEGNPSIVRRMRERGVNVLHGLVSDNDGDIVDFIITNNGQSSSILELEEHLREHPHVYEVNRIPLNTITVDTLLKMNNILVSEIKFVNIDIQGAELLALKGMHSVLESANYLYMEVNEKHLYRNCGLISEIDEYLKPYGFFRVETKMTEHGWGDALYMKSENNL